MNRFSTISTNDYVYIYWWKAGETVKLGVSRIAAFVVEHDFTIDKEDSFSAGETPITWSHTTGVFESAPLKNLKHIPKPIYYYNDRNPSSISRKKKNQWKRIIQAKKPLQRHW